MLDVEQNRRARKYSCGRDYPPRVVGFHAAAFSVQPEAVFRLEAISASLFRSNNWS